MTQKASPCEAAALSGPARSSLVAERRRQRALQQRWTAEVGESLEASYRASELAQALKDFESTMAQRLERANREVAEAAAALLPLNSEAGGLTLAAGGAGEGD